MRLTFDCNDWTIDRWRVERPLKGIQLPAENDQTDENSPPLWKDLTLASVLAIMLWGAVAILLG
ncbi:MAG: hypothetical protein ABIS06_20675 [Vicinamibacterales bacterium]